MAFSGLEYGADGEFSGECGDAKTLTEAERRAKTHQVEIPDAILSVEALKYCRCSELMDDNYFHAVFEASKGLCTTDSRIVRSRTEMEQPL